MGCSNCGTSKGGKPSGCKSNGGCSTGGCNRLNVHDWLANLPFSDPESGCRIVEVSFNQGSRKDYYRNATTQLFERGEMVSVEGVSGFDVGEVTLTGEVVRLQLKKKGIEEKNPEIKRILRRATDKDLEIMQQNKARERDALIRSRAIARQLKLDMKMSEVEIQADGRKATFFYIADDRVGHHSDSAARVQGPLSLPIQSANSPDAPSLPFQPLLSFHNKFNKGMSSQDRLSRLTQRQRGEASQYLTPIPHTFPINSGPPLFAFPPPTGVYDDNLRDSHDQNQTIPMKVFQHQTESLRPVPSPPHTASNSLEYEGD